MNANYWFYPALFALLGAALAFLCLWLDRSGFADWLNEVEWIAPARPQGASNMLQVIATSMIAVASTVFSITIVAVSYASGTYGPRLLTNFMEDKGNQLSLATFIGTFVYALTVLRTVRAEDESATSVADAVATDLPGFVPQLSLLVSFGLMAVSVGVLVFFLNHIPSGIRINNVLKNIGTRLIEGICKTYPHEGDEDGPGERPSGTALLAEKPGYVQLIDFVEMEKIARKCGCTVVLRVRTGDFLHEGLPVLEMCGEPCADNIQKKLRDCFTQGFARTPEQDPQFLIDELVEIGLRALSPGINDPFTAITSLHWLGAAMAQLGRRRLVKDICQDDAAGDCPVLPKPDDFHHYVERSFTAIRSAVATSPIAAKVMFNVLANAASTLNSQDRRRALFGEAERLREQARKVLTGPDLEDLEWHFTSVRDSFTL